MKSLLDSSVLIAGMLGLHSDHQRARIWLEKAKNGDIEAIVSADDYRDLIRHLAQASIAGGAVCDGIIACAGAKAQVDQVITLNAQRFPTYLSGFTTKARGTGIGDCRAAGARVRRRGENRQSGQRGQMNPLRFGSALLILRMTCGARRRSAPLLSYL